MTATRSFEARDSLPPNFADPDDPFAHRYVQFPTTITVDERDHGTYYHFHREYKEDSWSRARRAFLDLVDRFEGYPDEFEDMTPGQADRVLSAFLETLRTQRLILAELAFDDAVPDDSAGVWDSLWVRLEELRDEQAEDRLMASDDDEAGREFMLRLQQLEETVIRETFAGEPTIDFGAVDTMIDRLRWYRKRADPEFSEDLEIEVQLPGTIIVTNAPDIVGGMVTWDLDLSVLGTAEIELLATSFVPK